MRGEQMNLTIRIYPVGTGLLSESELNQIAAWHETEFSELPVSKQYEWTVGGHFNILLDVDGEFSGFVGLMKREVLFNGTTKLIAGIRGLVVDRRYRGRGLGKIIMAEAHKMIFRSLKADYGFLLCLHELESFYTTLGWQTLRCPVIVDNQNQKMPWTETAMILSRDENLDRDMIDEVDLLGKPF